jgi:hypothetical protein
MLTSTMSMQPATSRPCWQPAGASSLLLPQVIHKEMKSVKKKPVAKLIRIKR